MKTVSILVILAVLYERSEGLSCKTTADWSADGFSLSDKDCPTGTTCARPKREADKYTDAAEGIVWGCGSDCTVESSCLSCEGDGCNVEATFQCRTNAGDDTKSLCPDITGEVLAAETQCKRTLYDGTNFGTTGSWGCGGCADDAEDCADCTGTLCNDVAVGETHSCRKYVKTGDVFSEDAEDPQQVCQESTGQGCKMPTPDNTAGAWDACGKDCVTGGQSEAICHACDGDNCNDQTSVEYCKTGAHNAAANVLVSNFCADEDSKCERPFNDYGTLAAQEYGCGDCDGNAESTTCKVCGPKSDCNTPLEDVNTHECFEYDWTNDKWVAKAKIQCQAGDAAQKCNMPNKDAETPTGNDVSKNGCGPCVADEDQCTGTEPGENVDTNHKCFTWTWKEEKTEWEHSTAAVNCYTLDTETQCSLPKDRSKKEGFVADGTCAKCGTGDAHANCLTAEDGKNSGRRVLFSILALAVPIFYALL